MTEDDTEWDQQADSERTIGLLEQCRKMDADAFADQHPYPFLVFHPEAVSGSAHASRKFTTLRRGRGNESEHLVDEKAWRILPVVESPHTPWEGRISIGWAHTNDLVVRDSSVSKLHAKLSQSDDGTWLITDASSSNGVRVNDNLCTPEEPTPIHPGDMLTLGEVEARFVSARDLSEMVEGAD